MLLKISLCFLQNNRGNIPGGHRSDGKALQFLHRKQRRLFCAFHVGADYRYHHGQNQCFVYGLRGTEGNDRARLRNLFQHKNPVQKQRKQIRHRTHGKTCFCLETWKILLDIICP